MNKVLLLYTGNKAIERANKIANLFTDKYEIVRMERGYYGITHGSQSTSGFGTLYGINFPYMSSSYQILAPYCNRCPIR